MSQRHPLQWLRSWGKQEAQALAPWQRRWLQRSSLVLALALCALAFERHHSLERQRRDTKLQQGVELAAAQWSTLRATAYDWAHWDETDAFARGEAAGYPARNLNVANGLSSVAPVVLIINRSGALLTLQGRRGPSSWAQDPLVRCSQAQSKALLAAPQTLGIHCSDQNRTRLWIGVIEPITDTSEQALTSGLMVLLAPLRHPSHGPAMQALMQSLEQQVTAGEPGDQTLQLHGQPLWGTDRRVLNLNPKPVVGEAMAALGSDLSVVLPFLLSLLGLRAGLMLQRRRILLLQRREQQRSQQRLRRARRQLEQGVNNLSNRQREQALQLLSPGCGDPIDDLARKLEVAAQELRDQQETPSRSAAVLFEPVRNHQGELKRVHVLTGPENLMERYRDAIKAWSNLPLGVRCNLGLKLDLPPALWSSTQTLQALITILHDHNMPPDLCTVGIEGANASAEALRQHLPLWRNAGFALSWLHAAGALDPAIWLHKQWVDEVQLFAPGWSHPTLITPQQALIVALIELAHARDLQVSMRGVQQKEDLQGLWQRGVNLVSGPPIGGPALKVSELLIARSSP